MGSEYWGGLLGWLRDTLAEHGTISKEDLELLHVTDDVDEAVRIDHRVRPPGRPETAGIERGATGVPGMMTS